MRFIEETWSSEKLDNLCKITMGQSPSSKNYSKNSNDTILIQGNADLISGKIVPRIYTSEITKLSYPGDIILTVRAPVGDLAINEFDSCIGRGVCSIKGNKFIYYYLESLKDKHVWERLSQGSTFESVNSNDIKNLNLKIPSNSTQNHIINFFTAIDTKIELLQKKHGEYIRFKQYLMQNIFADKSAEKLRFDDNCHYKTKKVKDFLTESKIEGTDDINKRLTVKLNLNGITVRESKTIEKEGATKQFIRKSGQFIYGKQNLHKGAFGIVPKELDGYLSSSDIPSFDFKGEIEPKWFYYYFSRKSFYESLESLSTGTGSKRISPKEFLNIKLIVPELKEQHRIVCLFAKVDEEINGISNQILQMNRFKKSLLQQMFVVRINWRCNFKLAKIPSFNKHLLILKNKIIFIIIK